MVVKVSVVPGDVARPCVFEVCGLGRAFHNLNRSRWDARRKRTNSMDVVKPTTESSRVCSDVPTFLANCWRLNVSACGACVSGPVAGERVRHFRPQFFGKFVGASGSGAPIQKENRWASRHNVDWRR